MALFDHINLKAKTDKNTGFGSNSSSYGGRFINKNGVANIEKRGMHRLMRISWFHTMIDMAVWKFITVVLTFYITINLLFAMIYFVIGVEHLDGISKSDSFWEQFGKAYFFSAQTFTTVGYGHISPVGFMTSAISAAEALIGLLSFAIATGLFFGRFSKPTAFLKFSHNALITPYEGGTGLMVRLVPFKNTNFTDAEAKMTIGMRIEENGQMVNRFYTLDLELQKINFLILSWTLVHPINEQSPLYKFTKEDFASISGEILVYIKTFDDMFSSTVAARTSYVFGEIVYGAKFVPMYQRSFDDSKTILDLDKLNDFVPVEIETQA
ncbi:Inward rectifier potassium channel Irk [Flavobacterium faecale]|uniref:Inward rectifier potassium channel Irk n=1 Tax=Flavobacterium faecale TaxID=1355330 RepID=A0A2S1LH76_9FLAO|nr:ion channel [Flavobacterium faecale]AWG23103.1 Inward rectifier potassium channel Irk [Flavobacterium faecale]